MNKVTLIGVLFLLILTSYFVIQPSSSIQNNSDVIIVPIVAHIVDDSTVQFTSSRNKENIQGLIDEANRIWTQGNIQFVIESADTVQIDNREFNSIFTGNVKTLMNKSEFVDGRTNAYFAKYINANGVAFSPEDVFVVADLTTVNDFRTTAHELGHLLGLHHVQGRSNLMFKGSNGEILSEEEINTARKNARNK